MLKKLLFGLIIPVTTLASARFPDQHNTHHWYLLAGTGEGSTTWSELISQTRYDGSNPTNNTDITNPIKAGDRGLTINASLGYRLSNVFSIEAGYQHEPTAKIAFSMDPSIQLEREIALDNLYSNLPANGQFNSYTDAFNCVGKFHVPIRHTKFSAYAEAGMSYVRRRDILAHISRIGAQFGGGIDYQFNNRWFTNVGGRFTTGYGRSVTDPADVYIPFLYSVNLNVGYLI